MTTQINQLTELTTTSDDDLILIREDSTGIDKKMKAQNIRAKATTKDDVGLGNVENVDQTNADNLTSGTVPSARISGNYTGIDRTAAVFSHPTNTGSVSTTHTRSVIASEDSTASGDKSAVVASLDGVSSGFLSAVIASSAVEADANRSSIIGSNFCKVTAERGSIIASRRIENNVGLSLALGESTEGDASIANRKIHLFGENGNIYNNGELRFGNLNWSTSVPTGGWALDNSGGNLRVRDGTTERMRITSAGNVGIGTTSPGFPLSVVGSASATNLRAASKLITVSPNFSPFAQNDKIRCEMSTGTNTKAVTVRVSLMCVSGVIVTGREDVFFLRLAGGLITDTVKREGFLANNGANYNITVTTPSAGLIRIEGENNDGLRFHGRMEVEITDRDQAGDPVFTLV